MADGSLTYRALLRLFFALSRCVPLSWRYVLGMLATESVYWCWPSKRRNTQHNMAVVAGADAGSARANRLALLSWRNYGRYVVDFLNLPNVPPVEIVRRTTVDGWAHLDAVLAAGKGAIFVTGHFGLWDYAPAVLANRYPGRVYIVVEHLNSALLNELVQGQRALQGSTIIPMTNVRAMVRALRANGIIAVLVDRPVHDDGVHVLGACPGASQPARLLAAGKPTQPGGTGREGRRTSLRVVLRLHRQVHEPHAQRLARCARRSAGGHCLALCALLSTLLLMKSTRQPTQALQKK